MKMAALTVSTHVHAVDWLPVQEDSPDTPSSDSTVSTRENPGGLWSQKGVQPVKWYVIVSLITSVLFGYAFCMVMNSLASRFIVNRWNGGTGGTAWVLVNVLDPLWLIGAARAGSMAMLLAVVARREGRAALPWGPELINGSTWLGFWSGVTNALGYAFYLALVKLDGVAVWSAMVGLYVVAPSLWFMLRGRESYTIRKLVGVGTCAAAAVLLGMGKGEGSVSALGNADTGAQTASLGLKLALLAGVTASWGIADGTQATASKAAAAHVVAAAAACGFGAVGLTCLVLSWFVSALAADLVPAYMQPSACMNGTPIVPDAVSLCPPSLSSRVGGLILIILAQAVSMASWYGVSKLARLSEASSFLPILSLYTVLTSLGSVVLLGESLNSFGFGGLALSCVGIYALTR